MAIALGVHVGAEEVSASLVEADLPELGPISTRTVSVAAVPGGVGDAVTTMLGIMRVQAAQNDLLISGSGVVCDSIALCAIVRAALAAHQVRDVGVVDAGDPRLDADYSLGVAAALIGIAAAPAEWTGDPGAVSTAMSDEGSSGSDSDATGTPRSARLTMIGLGVAVLAALSGATVWALSASGPTQNSVVDTADVAEMPSSGNDATSSSVAVVADSAVPPPESSTVPPRRAGSFEAPVYGPVQVGTWSETLPVGPVPTSAAEVSSGGGNSGAVDSGGDRPGAVTGGGGNAGGDNAGGGDSGGGNAGGGDSGGGASGGGNPGGGDSGGGNPGGGDSGGGDSGGGVTPPVDPDPDPEPEPEPEVPPTDPSDPTTEVPEVTEPDTDPEPSADPVE
nr:hypothetical protein [uncultured Rhodococcus sp.]